MTGSVYSVKVLILAFIVSSLSSALPEVLLLSTNLATSLSVSQRRLIMKLISLISFSKRIAVVYFLGIHRWDIFIFLFHLCCLWSTWRSIGLRLLFLFHLSLEFYCVWGIYFSLISYKISDWEMVEVIISDKSVTLCAFSTTRSII